MTANSIDRGVAVREIRSNNYFKLFKWGESPLQLCKRYIRLSELVQAAENP